MQELDLSIKILNQVLDDHLPFSEALRLTFQSTPELRPMRANVSGLLGCELRHHLLFTYLLKEIDLTEEEKRIASLGLANDYFFRHYERDVMDEAIKEKLGEEKFALLAPLYEKVGNPDSYIPESISRSSNLYLSLRYNAPEWVLKIFQHFGFGNTYRTLKKFSRPASSVLRVKGGVSLDEVTANPEFSPRSDFADLVDYHGKTSLRRNELVRAEKLFEIKPFAKKVLDEYAVNPPKEILLYNGSDSCFLELELIEKYGESIGMNIAVPDLAKKAPVLRAIQKKGLHNVNLFAAPNGETLTSAVSRPAELVLVAPRSTSFDDIPSAPDFFLQFDKDEMDKIIEGEAASLENAAPFVEEGGKLLYLVFTISKKEGHMTIAKFLQTHPEFKLLEEKQHFPFEEPGNAAFLAVFEKKEKELTIAPNAPLVAEAPASAPISSAAAE